MLVHCHAGRSRSATICLAYLMNTLHLSLDNAFEHVRSRREIIDPNLNFMRQLQDYRQRLDRERAAGLTPGLLASPPSPAVPTASAALLAPAQSATPLRVLTPPAFPPSPAAAFFTPPAFPFPTPSAFVTPPAFPSSPFPSSPFPTPSAFVTPPAFPQAMETPRALAPVSLPSGGSVLGLFPAATSAAPRLPSSPLPPLPGADMPPPPSPSLATAADMPPPSPAGGRDFQCFFAFSSTEFPFPPSLARTPEIPLPS